MNAPNDRIAALRRTLASLERGSGRRFADFFRLGAAGPDAAFDGGLARGALHEIVAPQGMNGAAAAFGCGLAFALRAAGERPIAAIRQDYAEPEAGAPSGAGLAAFGADPGRMVFVRAPQAIDVLRAAYEAARCPALGAVVAEMWGEPRAFDLKASRRLALAAGRSGTTLILVRLGAEPAPSAATTRWSVEPAPSTPLEANAPGRPAFALGLLRSRSGPAGSSWHVEWDRERASFDERAPLSRPVVSLPAGGAAPARRRAAAGPPERRLAG